MLYVQVCPRCGHENTPDCEGHTCHHCAKAKYVNGEPFPEPKNTDPINSPSHYTKGGIETIDYMKAKMSPEQFIGYLVGNCHKYLSRFQDKNGLEDLKKCAWYLDKLIQTKETNGKI